MVKVWFIGEKRSSLAVSKGWKWESGHLSAVPLFDALRACGVPWWGCRFHNVSQLVRNLSLRNEVSGHDDPVIALGRKADAWLTKYQIPHTYMIHPAARGRVRDRDFYREHVRRTLREAGVEVK